MRINNKEIIGEKFVFDGCHKIYIIESKDNQREAKKYGYNKLLPIEKIQDVYENSCPLRFIYNWDLDTKYAEQGEDAIFEA